MRTVRHAIFGIIDPSVPGVWQGTRSFGPRTIRLDLTIDGSGLADEGLNSALARAEELTELDRTARLAILRDAQRGEDGASVLYVEHHLEHLADDDVGTIFGTQDRTLITPEILLSRLLLVRLGLYPEQSEGQLVLDYSLAPEITNYVLCVSFDDRGSVCALKVES